MFLDYFWGAVLADIQLISKINRGFCFLFGFTKKVCIGLLTSAIVASSNTKYVSLNNQQCLIQPTLINLHPHECTYLLSICS